MIKSALQTARAAYQPKLPKELKGNVIIKDKDIAKALDIDYNVFRKNKQYNKIPYFQIMQ